MTTSHRSGTHTVSGVHGATRIGRCSLVALAGLIGAVTLVGGLGGVSTSVAAAADPSYAWTTQGGGSDSTEAYGVSALRDGSSIITGQFAGTAIFGATTLISNAGSNDAFTAKVNADGTYAWATKGGGTGTDYANGVSALPDGSSIITGYFKGTASFGTMTLTSGGSGDAFTAKVNADGTYAWATKGGGTRGDSAWGVSALPDGSSIITGRFKGTAIFGTTTLIGSAMSDDTFTAKINADGTYAWATQAGGTRGDYASGVSALPDGSSIITGYFKGTASFGTMTLTSGGSGDAFTAKVNADGTYAWATKGGGTRGDSAWGVSALPDGSSIITGRFKGTAIFGTTTLTSGGSGDAFTAKVNADGTYAWATQAGGTGTDAAKGVSALPDGSSVITGYFNGTASFGTTTLTSGGSGDAFTAKVNADGTYAWATRAGGTGYSVANGVSALADGSSIITGYFSGTAIFETTTLTSAGSNNAFTARIATDAPPAPTGASASSGIRKAIITWNTVAGGLVSSYTATASPGGASCTAVAPTVTCTITNLTAGTSYTATVTATNQHGTSPPSRASNAVTPTDVAVTPPLTPAVNQPQSVTVTPDEPGTVVVTVAGETGAPPIKITTTWGPGTFTVPVTVTVKPQPRDPTRVAGGFTIGTMTIQLTVTDMAGNAVTQFAAPIKLHISASEVGDVPAFSRGGITWTPIPRLFSLPLPPSQHDGYFVNNDGSVDIYTRHATFFGLLKDTQAPSVPQVEARIAGSKLYLVMTVKDNVELIKCLALFNGRVLKAPYHNVSHGRVPTVTHHGYLLLAARAGTFQVVAIDTAGNKSKLSAAVKVVRDKRGFSIVKGDHGGVVEEPTG